MFPPPLLPLLHECFQQRAQALRQQLVASSVWVQCIWHQLHVHSTAISGQEALAAVSVVKLGVQPCIIPEQCNQPSAFE